MTNALVKFGLTMQREDKNFNRMLDFISLVVLADVASTSISFPRDF